LGGNHQVQPDKTTIQSIQQIKSKLLWLKNQNQIRKKELTNLNSKLTTSVSELRKSEITLRDRLSSVENDVRTGLNGGNIRPYQAGFVDSHPSIQKLERENVNIKAQLVDLSVNKNLISIQT